MILYDSLYDYVNEALSVRRLVRPSVGGSVRNTFVNFDEIPMFTDSEIKNVRRSNEGERAMRRKER